MTTWSMCACAKAPWILMRTMDLLFVIAYLLLTVSTDSVIALRKPDSVTWNVEDHNLVVSWQHSDQQDLLQGFYISLCQINNSKCAAPDFVHFSSEFRTAKIIGLAPESSYKLKVIAYSDQEHASSLPVVINTKKLRFLAAVNLTVSKVTRSSAIFYWNHEACANIHDIQFKLQCDGTREYLDESGELVQENDVFNHLSLSTSKHIEMYFTDKLSANMKYVCTLSSVSGSIQSPHSQKVAFTTQPDAPTLPPTPLLSLRHDSTFTVSLYPTNERYGAISHYLLIAVPVFKPKDDPVTAPYISLVPLKQLLLKALPSKMVSSVTQPIPFIVGSFQPNDLPKNYHFGYEWRSAFKQKHYYGAVLVAFTKAEESNGLYSLSEISNPPVYISEDLLDAWFEAQKPLAHQFTVVVVSCLVTVVILFSVAFSILFILNYYKAKRQDTKDDYMIIVSSSSSSDEEIFVKEKKKCQHNKGSTSHAIKKTPNQRMPAWAGPKVILTERSPDMTHAEWAIQNMSQSPAFREMVLKHPETLEGMDSVMTRIGKRWETDQRQDDAKRSPGQKKVDIGTRSHEAAVSTCQSASKQSHFARTPPYRHTPPQRGRDPARIRPPTKGSHAHTLH